MTKIDLENKVLNLRGKYAKSFERVKSVEGMIATATTDLMRIEFQELLVQRVREKDALQRQLHDSSMWLKDFDKKAKETQSVGSAGRLDDMLMAYGHLHRGVIEEDLKVKIISEYGLTNYSQLPF